MTIAVSNLPEGACGVMFYHDENGNNKLDKNIFGIPREARGGSLQDGCNIRSMPKRSRSKFELPGEGLSMKIASLICIPRKRNRGNGTEEMDLTTGTNTQPQWGIALLTGIAYMMIAVTGAISYFFIRPQLHVSNNSPATIDLLVAHESLVIRGVFPKR